MYESPVSHVLNVMSNTIVESLPHYVPTFTETIFEE